MTELSLASLLGDAARRSPDKLALVQGDLRLSYQSLWQDARRHAAALAARGVGPGTRVALMAPNVADFVRAYYGILAVGGVVVPIPSLLTAGEAAYLVGHSGASLVLYHQSLGEVALRAAETANVSATDVADLADGFEPLARLVSRQAEEPAVIFYTSGTTGRPKGAVLTHLNLVMNATVNAYDANDLRRDDVIQGCLPLFHVYGQTVSMNATFRIGATLVLQPRFNAPEALAMMCEERVTVMHAVPTMLVRLLEAAPGARTLPGLRYVVSGGASLPVAVLERFERTFTTKVYEGYGLSETSPTASTNQPAYGTRPGTVGHPVWGTEIEIADEAVNERIELLPTGQRGEVVVRGHNVFAGYLDDPAASAEAIVDGWFRTGDIGRKDEDGFITILDRKKDMIIRGGFNVYPREVEEVLLRHPDVAEVAVIGIPDEERGEEVCAVVVAEDAASFDADALIDWSRERLGGHKYPRTVRLVDEMPLGPSHKVLKRELRRRFGTPAGPEGAAGG